MLDRGKGTVRRGGRYTGFTLEVEDRPCLVAPRLEDVRAAVAELTPDGGPSFLILSKANRDYAQIAGGDGVFVFECREYDGDSFRHWAAGYPGEAVTGHISVLTNGYHVPAKSNENLNQCDVTWLFECFLQGKTRPGVFSWRDMTAEFT